MGRINIEIPQQGEYKYEIHNAETVKKLLKALEQIVERERDEEEDILGLWTKPAPLTKTARQ